MGPVDDGGSFAYLRPETAQATFTNFKNVVDSTARRPPFGIAQIGKSFRNEITPRNFIFRVREFEQMELEFFVQPGTDEEWHKKWVEDRISWWEEQGIARDNIELLYVTGDDLSHYSKSTVDLMYRFPHGVEELEGIANRTDFDLGSHTKHQADLGIDANVKPNSESNSRMAIQDIESKEWVVPYVIEPAAGVDRGVLAVLNEAYRVEQLEKGERTVLALPAHLSPIKAAVIPLKRNHAGIVDKARAVKNALQKEGLGRVLFENTGNIGKAYRRHDEVGTPLCITVDFQTIEEDDTVTVRDRDTMQQERVAVAELPALLRSRISG